MVHGLQTIARLNEAAEKKSVSYSYDDTVAAIKVRGMTQMPAILSEAVERAMEVGCFKDNDALIAFVKRQVFQIAEGLGPKDLERDGYGDRSSIG